MAHAQISAALMEELASCPLEIQGEIPSWLSGTLIRNGPVSIVVDGRTHAHWFDGLAMLHAFKFDAGRVTYSNRFLRTEAYDSVFKKGSLDYVGFAVDPCRSIFKRFLTQFFPNKHVLHNANINVAKYADQYVALTEIPLPVCFDIETLETLGVFDYQDSLPHAKCWESAHPHKNLNYLIRYGRTSSYVLHRLKEGSGAREIVAEVPVKEPAYMHSFALTERFVVFTEFPLVVRPLDFLTKHQPFIKNFTWEPARGTLFTVVERESGCVVGSYKTDPFFAFHHANAFERGEEIICDIVSYDNPGVIDGKSVAPLLERFTLSLKTGEIARKTLLDFPVEFPRINESFDGCPYRFVYLADPREEGLCPLYKYDTQTGALLVWKEEGCYPGEPVFASNGEGEDEGVVLAVIFDRPKQSSFLLILDAKTFEEVGRATVSHAIPAGLHGQFFR